MLSNTKDYRSTFLRDHWIRCRERAGGLGSSGEHWSTEWEEEWGRRSGRDARNEAPWSPFRSHSIILNTKWQISNIAPALFLVAFYMSLLICSSQKPNGKRFNVCFVTTWRQKYYTVDPNQGERTTLSVQQTERACELECSINCDWRCKHRVLLLFIKDGCCQQDMLITEIKTRLLLTIQALQKQKATGKLRGRHENKARKQADGPRKQPSIRMARTITEFLFGLRIAPLLARRWMRIGRINCGNFQNIFHKWTFHEAYVWMTFANMQPLTFCFCLFEGDRQEQRKHQNWPRGLIELWSILDQYSKPKRQNGALTWQTLTFGIDEFDVYYISCGWSEGDEMLGSIERPLQEESNW